MPKKNALIVDDEPDIRELLEITLGRMGIETLSAKDITSAKTLLKNNEFDFCMTDMHLPDGNGIEFVHYISSNYPQVPVAMITAHGSVDSAVEALKAGAFDFVSKPVNLELLRSLVDTALNLKPLNTKNAIVSPSILGETTAMIALRKQISILARSQAPIYISGESGSGKELVARSIHENGPRAGGPFIPVNCGAIPSELMESEFFGHTKGSFTGAVADKEGLFQAANGGTLFLDEVADLPLPMQVKLLRGIQEKAIRPIGSQQEVSVHVRILSATHKDLTTEVERGTFRQDLFYRINVIELRVPSLRERALDIPILAEDLLSRVAEDYQVPKPRLSSEALSELTKYPFPGNVRELANILERAITLCENDIITPDNLQLTLTSPPDEQFTQPVYDGEEDAQEPEGAIDKTPGSVLPKDEESLDSYLENIEKSVIVDALETTRWNKTAAAKKLGITFRALRYKLKKLGLD
ncbi:MAG: sigma-54-dependent Fis family transcriptional regulator [Gammaproteobacteria bacterium]|nr:sigma-54-dependent Fis family transcriptional regulator [Gammaproteobacteria bacterium]